MVITIIDDETKQPTGEIIIEPEEQKAMLQLLANMGG